MKNRSLKNILGYALDVALETIWPTRCAICDIPGDRVICEECEKGLQTVDACLACPRCGAPYGIIQCSECNDQSLASSGLESLPFEKMSHAYILDDAAKRIVSVYKDQGERRLCGFIAKAISRQMPPWAISEQYVLTYIPDSGKAYRRRGFDHSLEIAQNVSRLTGLELKTMFRRPSSRDQRRLTRRERIKNMEGCLDTIDKECLAEKIVIIDDVCTTGATIYAACLALKEAGAKSVSVVTFGQVLT